MHKVSLLICGKLRDRAAFEADLEGYLAWLRDKAVEKIVFSGWTSDLSSHSDLLERMAGAGIEVVLSDEPVIRTAGYHFHQAKSLHYGLAQFDPDDWVLKTRTDKISWSLSLDVNSLPAAIGEQKPVGPGSPFSERVLVLGALLFQPFFMTDTLFVGKARDLDQFANFDLWYERDQAFANTEQMLFFPPFRGQCPFTQGFFAINPGLLHGQPDLTSEIYRFLLDYPLYLHALREYATMLDTSFTLGLFRRDSALPGDVTWEAMLNAKMDVPGTYVPDDAGLRAGTSSELPRALLDIPIAPGRPFTLRDLDANNTNIQDMRDELCRAILDRWPDLPNLRAPDRMTAGLRIASTRQSLVG